MAKELRLAALQDPVAAIAFLETYEQALTQPDEFWQGRSAGAAEGVSVRQFIGEDAAGRWLGTVTVLVSRPACRTTSGTRPTSRRRTSWASSCDPRRAAPAWPRRSSRPRSSGRGR